VSRSTPIVAALADEIRTMPPGSRVPSEAAVGMRFGVGRAAARAALDELERRMLVSRVQGVGTFTRRRVDYLVSPAGAPSWSETVARAGGRPRTVVLACELRPAPAARAAALQVSVDEPAFRLVRRSFIDDVPAAWGVEWVPADLVPELRAALRHEDSLHRVLQRVAGVAPERAWTRASMEAVPEEASGGLGCRVGDPAWLIESVNRDGADGRPVSVTRRWVRADAVRVVVELGRS
jgi:DNA-binding GntR family transcriptional regulator